MTDTEVARCVGSTFTRGHLSHGCVMAFVRMSTGKQVGFLQERKLPEWEQSLDHLSSG